LTLRVLPLYLNIRGLTHAISCFIRFNVLALPPTFQLPLFSGESECKNTTIFQSTKIFFRLKPNFWLISLYITSKKIELFFMKDKKQAAKNKNKHQNQQKYQTKIAKTSKTHIFIWF